MFDWSIFREEYIQILHLRSSVQNAQYRDGE